MVFVNQDSIKIVQPCGCGEVAHKLSEITVHIHYKLSNGLIKTLLPHVLEVWNASLVFSYTYTSYYIISHISRVTIFSHIYKFRQNALCAFQT
ncbi:hypothetical protein VNO78_13649 [Psophocarpus tetragonolobus]|uniref:Uncharacterized protein n=1 Tax=Psophocarpus tetragonolobus TaxID=3891 RepID=A0AAN9SSD0_PSOTE